MKALGLVPKSLYVLPQHAQLLSRIEKALRTPNPTITVSKQPEGAVPTMNQSKWTTYSLYDALQSAELITSGQAQVDLIAGVDPAIELVMHEYGDLPILMSVSGEQLFCSTNLWDYDQVKDPVALNEALLLMNPLNPLSNFGLAQLPNGKKVYTVFGELSAGSTLDIVLEEIDTLARNTLEAVDGFADQLNAA